MRGLVFCGAAVLASLVSISALGGNLLRNGDFDSVDKDGRVIGWDYVPADYRREPSAGMNGTAGMKFVAAGRMIGTPLMQRVRVTPGLRYRYGAMGRTEKLVGNTEACARICLLWEDNWGRLMDDGCYRGARLKGDTEWTKIEAISPVMPSGAKWMTIRVEVIGIVEGGSTVCFDDAFLEPMALPPVDRLFCSAYRETQASGTVAFAAGINAVVGRPMPATAVFAYAGADGARKTKTVKLGGGYEAKAVLAVEDMALGEHEVSVEAFLADGSRYGGSSMKFTRTAEEIRRRVTFDRLGRTIVDGKPFFPLGMYWSVSKPYHKFQLPKMNAETVAEYAKGPFNCVMTYVPPARDVMDACQSNGIKVIYPLLGYFGDHEKWDPASAAVKSARAKIAEMKDHPAVLAWYLNDERPISMLDNLTGRRELVKECDPDHPTWSVLYQVDQIRDYMPTFDVVGTDPYPISGGAPISRAWEWADQTRRASFGIRPLWQVPQAFDWGTFRRTEEERAKCRMPTRDEMANMGWQAIAGGANGLVFYSYTYMMQCTKTPFEKAWADARSAAAEIKGFKDVILADGTPPHFQIDNGKSAAVRAWSGDGVRYALVVNKTYDAVSVAVTADEDFATAKALLGKAPASVSGRVITVDLPPISQTVLELR